MSERFPGWESRIQYWDIGDVALVRIPTKPAMHSNLKPATCSDPKPAGVPI